MDETLSHRRLKSPRAAAFAGIAFSVLFLASLVLIRTAVPVDPQDGGDWLARGRRSVNLGIYLLPFSGIAFLWFVGVLRDRVGDKEDRFFATVFMGSGLLFPALPFAAGVMMGLDRAPERLIESGMYRVGRGAVYQIINAYALKMAAVFMVSASTVAIRTGIFARGSPCSATGSPCCLC